MIVVDTNIIAYLYLDGEFTPLAEQLLEKDPQWAAPLLWRSEFRNVLALYMRKKLLDFDQAVAIQSYAEALLTGNEYQLDSLSVLELAAAHNGSAYDCEFVALAQRLRVPLVTTGKKLLAAFPDIAIALARACI
jgi:predicted nucleic acid-binding protein